MHICHLIDWFYIHEQKMLIYKPIDFLASHTLSILGTPVRVLSFFAIKLKMKNIAHLLLKNYSILLYTFSNWKRNYRIRIGAEIIPQNSLERSTFDYLVAYQMSNLLSHPDDFAILGYAVGIEDDFLVWCLLFQNNSLGAYSLLTPDRELIVKFFYPELVNNYLRKIPLTLRQELSLGMIGDTSSYIYNIEESLYKFVKKVYRSATNKIMFYIDPGYIMKDFDVCEPDKGSEAWERRENQKFLLNIVKGHNFAKLKLLAYDEDHSIYYSDSYCHMEYHEFLQVLLSTGLIFKIRVTPNSNSIEVNNLAYEEFFSDLCIEQLCNNSIVLLKEIKDTHHNTIYKIELYCVDLESTKKILQSGIIKPETKDSISLSYFDDSHENIEAAKKALPQLLKMGYVLNVDHISPQVFSVMHAKELMLHCYPQPQILYPARNLADTHVRNLSKSAYIYLELLISKFENGLKIKLQNINFVNLPKELWGNIFSFLFYPALESQDTRYLIPILRRISQASLVSLHTAVREEDTLLTKHILTQYRTSAEKLTHLTTEDQYGNTPIDYAMVTNSVKLKAMLLDEKIKVALERRPSVVTQFYQNTY